VLQSIEYNRQRMSQTAQKGCTQESFTQLLERKQALIVYQFQSI